MPLSVRLDDDLSELVRRLARRQRRTRSDVIRDAIRSYARAASEQPAQGSPLDRVRHLVGIVRGAPADLSDDTGRRFEDLLAKDSKKSRGG